MKKLGTLVAALVLFSAGAKAQTPDKPIKNKQWIYFKKHFEGGEAGSVCVAQTQKTHEDKVWTFALVVDPSKQAPPAYYIDSGGNEVGEKLQLQTNSSRTLVDSLRDEKSDAFLAKSLRYNEEIPGSTAYWLAPKSTSTLYKQLRRDSNLKVFLPAADGTQEHFYFSLSGSMATLAALEKDCDERREVLHLSFFDTLDEQPYEPDLSAEAGAVALRAALDKAWMAYFEAEIHQDAVKDLDASMAPLVREEEDYLRRTGRLGDQIEELRQNQEKTQEKRNQDIATRDRLQLQLRETEKDLSAALQDLKEKEDAFRPAAQQVRPYVEAVDFAERAVQNHSNQVAHDEQALAEADRRVRELEVELDSVERRISQLEYSGRDARQDHERAERELNSFHYSSELQRALNSDSTLRNLESAIRSNETNLSRLADERKGASVRAGRARNSLERCKASGDKGQKPDCSMHEVELRDAERELARVEGAIRAQENQLQQNRQRHAQRKNDIENHVRARHEALRQKVRQTQQRVDQIAYQIRVEEDRLRTLRNHELPRVQNQLRDARSELARSTRELSEARRQLSQSREDLDSALDRTDYHRKKAAYDRADATVDRLRDQADSLDSSLKKTEQSIASRDRALARLQVEIDQTVAELAKQSAGLEDIENRLRPLREQRLQLVALLEKAQQTMRSDMVLYRSVYENTFPSGPKSLRSAEPEPFYDWLL